MKKLYLFDDFGVALILCEFAGLDQDGKPQFVVKTPGKPLMSLEDYQEKVLYNNNPLLVLCEEGEKVDSMTMLMMMGVFVFDVSEGTNPSMGERIDEMKRLGINWSHEIQKLTISVIEPNRKLAGKGDYIMDIGIGEYREHDVAYSDRVTDLNDIFWKLRMFFLVVEKQLEIPLRKTLVISKELREKVKKSTLELFDEVENCK